MVSHFIEAMEQRPPVKIVFRCASFLLPISSGISRRVPRANADEP
jgi:hypothetical protein